MKAEWSQHVLGLVVSHCNRSARSFNIYLFSIYFGVHHLKYGDRQQAGKKENKEI